MTRNLHLEVALEMNGEDYLLTREIISGRKFVLPEVINRVPGVRAHSRLLKRPGDTLDFKVVGTTLYEVKDLASQVRSEFFMELWKTKEYLERKLQEEGLWSEELAKRVSSIRTLNECHSLWEVLVGFVPKNKNLRNNRELACYAGRLGTKGWRWFDRTIKSHNLKEAHEVIGAFVVTSHFRDKWEVWVEDHRYPDGSPSFNSAMWALEGLTEPLTDAWRAWALRHPRKEVSLILRGLRAVLKQGGHPGTPIHKLMEMTKNPLGDSPFALECTRWGLTFDEMVQFEGRWETACRESNIPYVEASNGKYTLWMLPKDDPRGLFLGEYTNCCQHPRGAGSSSAWHGVESPDGGFLVLFDDRGIVAQSWVWVDPSRDRLCLDNIEVKGGHGRLAGVLDLYLEVCRQWGEAGITQVNLGMGYVEDVETFSTFPKAQGDDLLTPPEGVYTDAGVQRVLWKKEV